MWSKKPEKPLEIILYKIWHIRAKLSKIKKINLVPLWDKIFLAAWNDSLCFWVVFRKKLSDVVPENWVKFKVKYSVIEPTLLSSLSFVRLSGFFNIGSDRYVVSAERALNRPTEQWNFEQFWLVNVVCLVHTYAPGF